jgi:pantothenate kinase
VLWSSTLVELPPCGYRGKGSSSDRYIRWVRSETILKVSADGAELDELAASVRGRGRRWLVGVVGAPGSGKSAFCAALLDVVGPGAVGVPMDGFHLADMTLERMRLLDRKGAPETFDAWGYAALLERVRTGSSYDIYAPGFERTLEQPIAAAITVPPEARVVLTEGNYLLLDRPEWRAVRAQLDEVWYVATDEALRLERLTARHVEFGKSEVGAREWVDRVDEPNARLVEATRPRADRVIDLSAWRSAATC